MIREEEITEHDLLSLERLALKLKTPVNCFLGNTDTLNVEHRKAIEAFCAHLQKHRVRHIRIIIAHEESNETPVAKRFPYNLAELKEIRIPSFAERADDVREICNSFLGYLRTAHPFINVTQISEAAIQTVIDDLPRYNYNRLVRVLRNALALSNNTVLLPEDLESYGESDITTRHLLETMADDKYFGDA